MIAKKQSTYRLELLPVVPPYHRRSRNGKLNKGQLVYYGPTPIYYGIGEIISISDRFVHVDFRGTGQLSVHESKLEKQYLIPVPPARLALL